MHKKGLNKLCLNILNIYHLESNFKKKNIIQKSSYPINKIKTSNISSLLLLQKKKPNNQMHQKKNNTNKNVLMTNELMKSNKKIPRNSKKKNLLKTGKKENKNNRINNINQININNNYLKIITKILF